MKRLEGTLVLAGWPSPGFLTVALRRFLCAACACALRRCLCLCTATVLACKYQDLAAGARPLKHGDDDDEEEEEEADPIF